MAVIKWLIVCVSLGFVFAIPPPPEEEFADDIARVAPPSNGTATVHPALTSHPTHPPVTIRSRYVTKDGRLLPTKPTNESAVRIEATNFIPKEAVEKAAKTMAGMVKHMPQAEFVRVAGSRGVRLFPSGHGLTIYPDMARHADTPECLHNCKDACRVTCVGGTRKFSKIGGLTAGYSYVVDGNVMCNKHDGYHKQLNVLGHEFAHLIMFHLTHFWQSRIHQAYTKDKAKQTWGMHSYAMSNANEYWAEASGAYFMFSHMLYTSGGMNRCGHGGHTLCPNVTAARQFIHQRDPDLYAILDYVYNNNAAVPIEHVKPCM